MSAIGSNIFYKKICMPVIQVCGGTTVVENPTGEPPVQEKWTKEKQITDYYDTKVSGFKDMVLPAGAYYVEIRNTDSMNSGLTVNGEEILYGKIYHREVKEDKARCIQDFVEELNIKSNGTHWVGSISYPSDSGLTQQNIFQ